MHLFLIPNFTSLDIIIGQILIEISSIRMHAITSYDNGGARLDLRAATGDSSCNL